MLGMFPESVILLILPVAVHGVGEVADVAAVLGSGLGLSSGLGGDRSNNTPDSITGH